jgi:hypothetical protein
VSSTYSHVRLADPSGIPTATPVSLLLANCHPLHRQAVLHAASARLHRLHLS